ncbi:hypothetical protein EBR21_06320 [bacterium]|nr:hypothetical protein [bacterium]
MTAQLMFAVVVKGFAGTPGRKSALMSLAVGAASIGMVNAGLAQPAATPSMPASASSTDRTPPQSSTVSTNSQAATGSMPMGGATESPLHSVPPSSLLGMRLHPAALPLEAEVSCSLMFGCELGLTRGFAVGSEALKTIGVTTMGQHIYGPGAWTYMDANLGYQFLRMAERQSTLMGTFGYRSFSYKNSEGAKFGRSGVAFRTAYAEAVLPAYTQGMVFDVFSSTLQTEGGADQPFSPTDEKRVRGLVKEFAQFMRSNPLLRLQMPADLEIINWSPSQVDLPGPMRGFLRISPSYEQTDLVIRSGEQNLYTWIEKRFALQLMLMTTFASPEQRSGRLGLLGGLGFEMAATKSSVESKSTRSELNPEIPSAPIAQGKLEIQGTWQF